MSIIGFARVSAVHQDLSSQISQLTEVGCEEIFSGKQSGAKEENQKKLDEMINYIRKGDMVYVTRLDRLGRSLKSILQNIDSIHEKGVTLKTLDGAIDTSNESPLAKATISLLGTFAQLERDLILDRTSEGRARAMAEGRKMGRPPILSDDDKDKIHKAFNRESNPDSISRLSKKYSVSRMTISRIVRNVSYV
ncbi:recombinase family protein [Paraglaciecola chathamensis]|uniref:Recombinase family protein n=1 Tax=Paraglaciecola chathamensis TaxID=368405 RepID=A0ABS0WAP5_9ALTE|nr:recombinase family protein [Paraglaciecola chathamensis]MBJ2135537.1 recombinase family protein [Paraglaciecola chathamensis]|tara:strand:+ start:6639 stop:7217 length:579 start_codon:yes stop_codon:yes gene_type:complete